MLVNWGVQPTTPFTNTSNLPVIFGSTIYVYNYLLPFSFFLFPDLVLYYN